jgi:hypothetical protein
VVGVLHNGQVKRLQDQDEYTMQKYNMAMCA